MADDFFGKKLTISLKRFWCYVQSPTGLTRFHLNKFNEKQNKTAGDR